MIVVRAVFKDGHSNLETSGHAAPEVCAAVSAIMQGAALALRAIALTHPDDVATCLFEMPEGTVQMLPPESGRLNGLRTKRAE